MRHSRGVQASATAIKFGCKKSPSHFLSAYGWDAGGPVGLAATYALHFGVLQCRSQMQNPTRQLQRLCRQADCFRMYVSLPIALPKRSGGDHALGCGADVQCCDCGEQCCTSLSSDSRWVLSVCVGSDLSTCMNTVCAPCDVCPQYAGYKQQPKAYANCLHTCRAWTTRASCGSKCLSATAARNRSAPLPPAAAASEP